MRVVHLFKDYFPPTTGGIEQHMQLLCAGLARTHEVVALVPSRSWRGREETRDGVRIVGSPSSAASPRCRFAPPCRAP